MENNVNEILGKVTEFLRSEAKTETIIGKEFKLGDYSCVPVMSVGLGLAGGFGEGNEKKTDNTGSGMGGGVGIGMGPVGFLVTKGTEIQFIPSKTSSGLSAAVEKLPGLIEKLVDKTMKKETV
jgi:uncharacterized spore protein YtfJ